MRTISEPRKLICADAHTAQEILKAMFNAIEQAWEPIVDVEWHKDKFGGYWRTKRREAMEMTQYQKDLVRMWDSLRPENKGSNCCLPTFCRQCPFYDVVCRDFGMVKLYNAEKAIEIVAQWAKEHPIVTMADKYKEVFGVEPKGKSGASVCPRSVGFDDVECKIGGGCEDCRNEFWHSEYRESKKEGE